MTNSYIRTILNFFIFIILQVVLFKNIVLGDYAFCFFYVGFVLLLPLELPVIPVMILAFTSGLIVDIFYDTLGINASASVLLAYSRSKILSLLMPKGGYDLGVRPIIKDLGFQWVAVYSFALIFIHHLALFLVENSTFYQLHYTLLKIVTSSFLTFFVLMAYHYIFLTPKRK